MPQNITTNELLDRYLSGAITAPQEAELERRAQEDPVLAEALAGLQAFPEADHDAHVAAMMKRARARVQVRKAKVRPLGRYAAAAAVALLVVAALFLLPRAWDGSAGDLAMKTEAAPEPPPLTAPAPEPEPAADALVDESDNDGSEEPPSPASSSTPSNPRPRPDVASASPPADQAPAPAAMNTQTEDEPLVETDELEEVTAQAPPPPVPTIDQEAARSKAERRALAEAEEAARKRRSEREDFGGALAQEERQQGGLRPGPQYVTGRITDENGEPIVGALIRLPGQPIGERTDTSGVFQLSADATTSRIEVSHPDFEDESIDLGRRRSDLQLTLEKRDTRNEQYEQAWAPVKIPMGSGRPGYALPEEGYNALRRRIENNKPEGIPAGKIKLSFIVNSDGTLEDFIFRGQPDQATMDYIGETIMRTSIWNVVQGEEPVRVYFKVVFE